MICWVNPGVQGYSWFNKFTVLCGQPRSARSVVVYKVLCALLGQACPVWSVGACNVDHYLQGQPFFPESGIVCEVYQSSSV